MVDTVDEVDAVADADDIEAGIRDRSGADDVGGAGVAGENAVVQVQRAAVAIIVDAAAVQAVVTEIVLSLTSREP